MLYVIDQLSSASIEVTSESTDITDKKGNVVRRIYNSKSATLTGSLALLSPVSLAAMSGEDIVEATAAEAIKMPSMRQIPAGSTIDVHDAVSGSVRVIEIYSNGAQGSKLTQSTMASLANKEFGLVTTATQTLLTVPAKDTTTGEGADSYLVVYDRDETNGMKISNHADQFPGAVKLIMAAALIDPCTELPRAGYIVAPNAQPDPSMTINLDSEATETDITYNLNVDYCGCDKALYHIYFPDEDVVTTVTCKAIDETAAAPTPTPTPTPTTT